MSRAGLETNKSKVLRRRDRDLLLGVALAFSFQPPLDDRVVGVEGPALGREAARERLLLDHHRCIFHFFAAGRALRCRWFEILWSEF